MGSVYEAAARASASIQDLKVAIQDSTLIYPTREAEKKSHFLSNIDQVLNFHVQTLHFFSANPDFPPEIAITRLKNALQKVMVVYEFLGGRLKMNDQTGRLEIDCSKAAGAGFVVATTQYSLQEIADLVYPNPAFMQLILLGLSKFDDNPLCVLQVTSFKCGGLALGVSTNHALFDGLSFKIFLDNLASQAFDHLPIRTAPCNDRHLLAARSPPLVSFPHPELLELKTQEVAPPVFHCKQEDLAFEIFSLSSDDVESLKQRARARADAAVRITGFNVIAAHIWRCKALSFEAENNRERESRVLYAVDIRSRLKPPLPASYCGNAVLSAYAAARCWELEEEPLWKTVGRVGEAAARVTDEYARSVIDWGEIHKGFPEGEFLISSWWRLGLEEVDFPWGRPTYSCPLVRHTKDIILLFPNPNGNGVNVLLALPSKQMEIFKFHFHSHHSSINA